MIFCKAKGARRPTNASIIRVRIASSFGCGPGRVVAK